METNHKTFCRNCGAQCGMEVTVDGSRIVSIRGDQSNPVSKGYMCVKGRLSQNLHNGEGRLPRSLRRNSAGQHEPIDTSSALDEIGDRLKGIVAEHGPRSVAMYYGTGAYQSSLGFSMSKSWLRALGSPHLYSTQTIDQSPKVVTALRMGYMSSGRQQFADSDVWLFSGTNPLASHLGGWGANTMYAPAASIRAAMARGLKLIVVDPRRTETARLADLHLQVKPGQDVAVFAGMLHIILKRAWHDQAFCARHVKGLDALRAAVAPYVPAYAATEAGIDEASLVAAAEMFAGARRGCASSGTGTNMAPHANLAEHLLECLNAVCGRYRRVGDQVLNVSALSNSVIQEVAVPPFALWEHSPRMASHPEAGYAVPDEFPSNLLSDEILHEGPDRIRALIVNAGNPALAFPGHQRVMDALRKLDILVTLEIRPTATTALSHYVIACKTPYERPDLSVLTEGNSPFAAGQYTEAVATAAAETVEEREVFFRLGQRMGLQMDWHFSAFGIAPSAAPVPLDMSQPPSADWLFEKICMRPDVPFEAFKSRPGGQVFALETQRVEAAVAVEAEDAPRLDLMPEMVRQELDSCLSTRQRQNLASDEYLLISRRLLAVLNSNFVDDESVRSRWPGSPLYMHPDDIAARALTPGQSVIVTSDAGALRARLRNDSTLRCGTVAMHHAWGQAVDANQTGTPPAPVGILIGQLDCVEAINYVPRMSAIPVRVEPIPVS